MGKKNDVVAIHETGRQLETQTMELYQVNQLTDQAQRNKSWLFGELELRNKAFQVIRDLLPTNLWDLLLRTESNEIKYLREATELIERWQQQLQDGQPVSRPPSEHGEVILIERQW